jgi:hypothetical protein
MAAYNKVLTPYGVQQDQAGNFTPIPGMHTYANLSPQTEQALNLTEQRALAGSPVSRGMQNQLTDTLNGNYLYGNPGFDAAFQAAANKITPMVQSEFNRKGRLHSGLAREAETRALADAFASQYSNERQNQIKAMLFAPEAAQADYNDIARLAGVGQARESVEQNRINEDIARHDWAQMDPWRRLELLSNIVYGSPGDFKTLTERGGSNKASGILGGILKGATAGSQINPLWGTILGGAGGGLLGAF